MLAPHGNRLLGLTRRNLRELDAAMSHIERDAKGMGQSLSVGTTPLVAANILPQAIREFRCRQPDLRIRLFDANLNTILKRVEAGKLDIGLDIFKSVPGILRTSFFWLTLAVIRPDEGAAPRPASTAWSALNGQKLISLSSSYPRQQLIDEHLARNGVRWQRGTVATYLDTQIALVEAHEGVAIIPSFGLPVCGDGKVVISQLI